MCWSVFFVKGGVIMGGGAGVGVSVCVYVVCFIQFLWDKLIKVVANVLRLVTMSL